MTANPILLRTLIQKTPGVMGGDACIRGTRIPVWMMVNARHQGVSDAELLTRYDPPITAADLEAACHYYASHTDEIDIAIREQEDV